MTKELYLQAIIKFICGVILIGLLLFLPAGTLNYTSGWLFMGILFIPMFCAGIVMMLKNPELLKKRLNAKEKQAEQSVVIKLSGLMFIVGFVVAGLNHRFQWIVLPDVVSWISAAVFSFVIFLAYPVIIVKRIKNEEQVLEEGLEGYIEYKKKVKYRLIPFVW